jgi:hypothetical protein
VSFLDKAKEFADKHDDKVDQALEKIGEQVDQRTDSKYTDKIDKGVAEAQRRTGPNETT